MLMGDVADNIPGIYGIGPKTVEKLFQDCKTQKELETVTKRQYKEIFPEYTKEQLRARFLEVGQLLWIRRHEGEMWTI
jgi:5'-3' exonuclease